jgi:tight adherence protein C
MDLLALSMEAGLGFTLAIEKVVQKGSKSELNREFSRLLRDIKMGLTMRDALRGLATRTDMYEIRSFATALIQADTLGTPLAEVLQTQAEIRRTERFQRAEKLAQEAPVKMLFPLLFFIFPAVFIAILTPIILQFMAKGM